MSHRITAWNYGVDWSMIEKLLALVQLTRRSFNPGFPYLMLWVHKFLSNQCRNSSCHFCQQSLEFHHRSCLTKVLRNRFSACYFVAAAATSTATANTTDNFFLCIPGIAKNWHGNQFHQYRNVTYDKNARIIWHWWMVIICYFMVTYFRWKSHEPFTATDTL